MKTLNLKNGNRLILGRITRTCPKAVDRRDITKPRWALLVVTPENVATRVITRPSLRRHP